MPQTEIFSQIESLRAEYSHVAMRQYNTENCFGDNIQNSKIVSMPLRQKILTTALIYMIYIRFTAIETKIFTIVILTWIFTVVITVYKSVMAGIVISPITANT